MENLGTIGLTAPSPFGPVGRGLLWTCRAVSIVGGLVLTGLVVMSLISIVGRKLYATPVPGDREILEMIAAAVLASFFAYCHLKDEDVKVDFFTNKASPRVRSALDMIGSLLVAGFGFLLAWRTAALAIATHESGETSPVLTWPMWYAQAVMVPGFGLLTLAGLYMATLRARFVFGGR